MSLITKMQATIEEPLICHMICSYLPMYNLDQIRRTSSSFLEAALVVLRDVNIVATNGLYTIGSTYYVPCLDEYIYHNGIQKETDIYRVDVLDDVDCLGIKKDVDHIYLGKYIGIVEHDYIDMVYAQFGDDTLDDLPWDPSEKYSLAIYLDNRTKKYASSQNISLNRSLFGEAIVVGHDIDEFYSSYFPVNFEKSKVVEGVSIRPKCGYATIKEFIEAVSSYVVPKKIMFDGRLLFY